ncbi:MAG: GldG family protein [bacterium]|nr:GldG family protein [bacterium]
MVRKLIPGIGIIGIIGLIICLGILLVIPTFPLWLKIATGISTILTLLYVGYYWDNIMRWLKSAPFLTGANTTVFILAIIVIFGLINYLGVRHHKQFDLTKSKKFTLSEQTKKIVRGIKQPVLITAYYRQIHPEYDTVKTLLNQYTALNPKISVQFVDIQVNPRKALQDGVRYDGTSILESEGRKERITGNEERDFTAALLKLTKLGKNKIYFISGHGEHSLDAYNEDGYSQLKEALLNENYLVNTLSLTQMTTIPADAAVIVIGGPKKELLANEVQLLSAYLKSGGKSLILLDPAPEGSSLAPILEEWHIKANKNIVVDLASYAFPNIAIPAVREYPWHEITRSLEGLSTIYPLARSISIDTGLPDGLTVYPLVKSSDESWGVTDLNRAKIDRTKDSPGPLNLAVTVTKKVTELTGIDTTIAVPETRLVVFGDSDFVSNAFLDKVGNRDIFLNSLAWLVEQPELVGIRAKEPEQRQIFLIGYQWRLVAFTSLLFLPLIVFFAGIVVWWKRR